MIQNEEQLQQTRGALNDLESALAALKRDILPLNAARFAMMSETVVDEIRRLRGDIEEYVGVRSAITQQAEFWMRLEGPDMQLGDAPSSIVTTMLDILRVGIQTVAEFLQRGSVSARPTAEIKKACDLRILEWIPGSVQVGLRLPDSTPALIADATLQGQVRNALRLYMKTAAWAGSDDDVQSLEDGIPGTEERRLLLNQVSRLIPRPRGALEAVELYGREVAQQRVRLKRDTRHRIRRAITQTFEEQTITAEGVLREIDLDQRTFIVRQPGGPGETRCSIDEDADDLINIAKYALDHHVVVTGEQRRDLTRRQSSPLRVREIEILERPEDVGQAEE